MKSFPTLPPHLVLQGGDGPANKGNEFATDLQWQFGNDFATDLQRQLGYEFAKDLQRRLGNDFVTDL